MTQDILTLGMQADEVRRRLLGTRVTYQRVQVIGSVVHSLPDIVDAATEVRLIELPPSLEDALGAVRALRSAAGPRRVAAYALPVLMARAREGWPSLDQVLTQLRAAGADDVAEMPVDELDDLPRAVDVVRNAGLGAQRLTMTHPAGANADACLSRVAAAGVIRRFAPLPRIVPTDKPTTGYEDVRMVALARLALATAREDGGAVSIEVDWTSYGPKLAQVALLFGADHLDAVSPASDLALGKRRETVEDVERNIRAAGFEPQEYRPQ